MITLLGFAASQRDGSWDRVPLTDAACFYKTAYKIYYGMQDLGIGQFHLPWIYSDRVHAPLVPALSAFSMLLFGPSKVAIEAVLPLFLFIFLFSTFVSAEILYNRLTAFAVAGVVTTFPVVINLSRLYIFELPFAALVVAACACLLKSRGLLDLRWTLAFGVLSGLAALARAGGPVLLAGPVIVYFIFSVRGARANHQLRLQMGRRIVSIMIAGGAAAVLAATWYVPNWPHLNSYLASVTYGDLAPAFVQGSSPLAIANMMHYLEAIVVEGPGVPLLAIAVICYFINNRTGRGGAKTSQVMLALALVFIINYLILLIAAQRCGAVLFVSMMPILAAAGVRAVANMMNTFARRAVAFLLAGYCIFQAVATTLFFPLPPDTDGGAGPFPVHFPLWSHRSMHLQLAGVEFTDIRVRYPLEEIVDQIELLELPPKGRVYVMSAHPYANVNGIQFEAVRRKKDWEFKEGVLPVLVSSMTPAKWHSEIRTYALRSHALVVKSTKDGDEATALYQIAIEPLVSGPNPFMARAAEPWEASDGTVLTLYKRSAPAASAPPK
ncbi:MAG: ArnT family glycosyltransferase [Planctomycetota bacterium]